MLARRAAWLRDAALVLGNRSGAAALDLVVLAVAGRLLASEDVGAVLLAQATAALGAAAAGMGLYPVIVRRAARGELGPRALAHATALRAAAGALVAAGGLAVATAALPERAIAFAGFLVAYGLEPVHEPSRAALAGQRRFGAALALALGARLGATALSIGLLHAGLGLGGWLLGRVPFELLHLVGALAVARRRLAPSAPPPGLRALLREGRPFWLTHLVGVLTGRAHVLAVGALLGLRAAAAYGIGERVAFGGLILVGSLASAAFPRWARRPRAPMPRDQLAAFALLAVGIGTALALLAPLLGPLLLPDDAARAGTAIRALALAGGAAALAAPLCAHLESTDREGAVVRVRLVAAAVSLAALAPLALRFGIVGAAASLVLDPLLQIGLAAVVMRRAPEAADRVGEA